MANKIAMIGLVMILIVLPSSVVFQAIAQNDGEQIETINLGTVEYSLLKMKYTPIVSTINTTADSLNFVVGRGGSKISLAGITNIIQGWLLTPDNETIELETLTDFTIDFVVDGNYTIRIIWKSWIPVIGGLVEKITGSGSVDITITKTTPPEPSKIGDYVKYLVIIISITVVITLICLRKRLMTWLK